MTIFAAVAAHNTRVSRKEKFVSFCQLNSRLKSEKVKTVRVKKKTGNLHFNRIKILRVAKMKF